MKTSQTMQDEEKTAIMLQKQVNELQQQNELMRQLGTQNGFFQAYFKILEHTRTNEEAFNMVNEKYFDLWGEYRYSGYESFNVIKNRHFKKTTQ